jgi:hypothetical protein
MTSITLQGRIIKKGGCTGEALVSAKAIGFLGGVDPETGVVLEAGHPLEGQSIAGRVLVIPNAKGSTVGSYVMYRLKKAGCAPVGLLCAESEPTVAVGAIISDIPMLDQVDIARINTGDVVTVAGETITVERK